MSLGMICEEEFHTNILAVEVKEEVIHNEMPVYLNGGPTGIDHKGHSDVLMGPNIGTLEDGNTNQCKMIPIIEDNPEVSVNEVVVQENNACEIDHDGQSKLKVLGVPKEEEGLSGTEAVPLDSIRFTTNIARGRRSQIRYKVIEESEYNIISDQENYNNKILTDDDPRNHVHYVRYIKRDGKTHKVWKCGICGKEFRHQYTLMRHLPTHTDERNFKCETCGKGFRQMSTLSQHRAIHSDARPYICELCKKTFNRVSTLISHRKTHSEHKPHTCEVCGKGFHQKGNLRNHIFTHTNERPYKCDLCNKGFNQMSNLMCHKVKAHSHGDKTRYVCSLCNLEFPRKYALRSHEEYKHGKYRNGEKLQEMDSLSFNDIIPRKQKRYDEKTVRIVQLPNGDRAVANMRDVKNFLPLNLMQRHKITKPVPNQGGEYHDSNSSVGVIIDPISTKAMQLARQTGQTPFALLKLAKGNPVLVKVMMTPHQKHVLVPASAEDLKSANEITVSPNFDHSKNGTAIKGLQIRVPIVATVVQQFNPDGHLTIQVESPGRNELGTLFDDTYHQSDVDTSLSSLENPALASHYSYGDKGKAIPKEEGQKMNSVNILAAAVSMLQENQSEHLREQTLMELASSGDIQFLYPSRDGIYEVLSQEEAAEMMQQPGQTIEVVSEESENKGRSSMVGKNNLSEIVEAICSAGYQVTAEHEQMMAAHGMQEQAIEILP